MDDIFTALTTPPPAIPESDAAEFLHDNYGFQGSLQVIVSERDQNFRVKRESGESFVLKIANPAEAPEVTDFQNEALLHVEKVDPELPVPRVVRTIDGSTTATILDADSRGHTARVLTWLEGVPLSSAATQQDNAGMLGQFLARLGIALRDFEHPASDYHLPWDLKRAGSLVELLDKLEGEALQAHCRQILNKFKSHTKPALNTLRSQVIHDDLHSGNVLVDSDSHSRITGVIDFGDIVRSPLIVDVAVAAAYLIADGKDPLADMVRFLSAYTRLRPLQREEVALLYDLILTRNVMSLVIGGWRATLHPENSDYILGGELEARKTIEILTGLDQSEVAGIFLRACRL
jgi:hydroxylysine kinase